jgi:hypothetical protein
LTVSDPSNIASDGLISASKKIFSNLLVSSQIISVKFRIGNNNQQMLCVGCGDRTLIIYKVPQFISKPIPDEKELMGRFVDQQLQSVKQTRQRFDDRTAAPSTCDKLAQASKTETTEQSGHGRNI